MIPHMANINNKIPRRSVVTFAIKESGTSVKDSILPPKTHKSRPFLFSIPMFIRTVSQVSRSLCTLHRRHFTVAAHAKINGNGHATQQRGTLRSIPKGSDGRFYIEQL